MILVLQHLIPATLCRDVPALRELVEELVGAEDRTPRGRRALYHVSRWWTVPTRSADEVTLIIVANGGTP